MDHKFHPVAICVATSENEQDFTFLFKVFKKGVELVSDSNYEPMILIADAALAITNGFKNIFKNN